MIGPKPVKSERWAVVDYEGNVLSVHYSESQADSAAWEKLRENSRLRLRTCEVVVTEVK